jgi:ribosome maturation factor RimP
MKNLIISEKTSKLAENVARAKGLEIVETKFSTAGRRGLVRVFIAKPGGVSIEDCSNVSRELGVLLDAEGIIDGPYTLEVSSPGLDRPLKTKRDYERNIGNLIKVEYRDTTEKAKSLKGTLSEICNDHIIICNNAETHTIHINSVIRARIETQF